MYKKNLRIKNIFFRVIIIVSTYVGIKTIAYYAFILLNYGKADAERTMMVAGDFFLEYLFFIVTIIAVSLFNCILKPYKVDASYIIRTGIIIIALVLGLYSFPAVLVLSSLAFSRYSKELIDFKVVSESGLVELLQNNPFMFYGYMVSVALMLMIAVHSVIVVLRLFKVNIKLY